jgi:hypothetical protein
MELTRTTQLTSLDEICANFTGFASFDDLLNSFPTYRPSLDVSYPVFFNLANAYDRAMEDRGDARRAFRYGEAR